MPSSNPPAAATAHPSRRSLHTGRERGSIMTFFAISLTALLAVAALLLDGGTGLWQRRVIQNAADAAAFAGARSLALGGSSADIGAQVNSLAGLNGADSATWHVIGGNTGVEVVAEHTFDTGFAGMFGHPTITVRAIAQASMMPVATLGNLLPMTTMCEPFVYGQTYQLWDSDKEAPGAFGWLDWDGVPVGNSELVDNLEHPSYSGTWSIGDWIPSGPGVQFSSGVSNALDGWIGKHVTIPLYDEVTGNGSHVRYRICGFGEFVLTDYDKHGNDKYVEGHFIRWVQPGTGNPSAPNYGISTLRLTQ